MTRFDVPSAEDRRTGERTDDGQLQFVTFRVGEEQFAVDILAVREINRLTAITQAPQSPPGVQGMINLRGRIVPVIDLRQRFGLPAHQASSASRIMVVDVDGRTIGFTVDRVDEVLRVDRSVVEPTPADITGGKSQYLAGIGKLPDRLVILLDLNKLLASQDLDEACADLAA